MSGKVPLRCNLVGEFMSSAEALLWWHPGRDFVVAPFFVLQIIGEDKKKGFHCKISGFSFQKYVKTKKKGLHLKISGFLVQMRMETTKQSEKREVFTTNRWSYGFKSYYGVTPKR